MKYINTNRDTRTSDFVRTEPDFDGTTLTFRAQGVKPVVAGQVVQMVKGSVRVATPTSVEVCGATCPGVITEAVQIDFNLLQGGDNLAKLRDEVIRVMDVAISEYQLANAIIPPATATFVTAP